MQTAIDPSIKKDPMSDKSVTIAAVKTASLWEKMRPAAAKIKRAVNIAKLEKVIRPGKTPLKAFGFH